MAPASLPPPYGLVAALMPPGEELVAPIIDAKGWQDFRHLVEATGAWFTAGQPPAAIVGHSLGAWLSLAVCADLGLRPPPPMLLLAPVLGTVRIRVGAGLGFVPPRERAIRGYICALDAASLARLTVVAAEGDINTDRGATDRLIGLGGVTVEVVASDHRLSVGEGPVTVGRAMRHLTMLVAGKERS